MDNAACIRAYAQNFVSDIANLIVVTNTSEPDAILNIDSTTAGEPNQGGNWICDGLGLGSRPCYRPLEMVDVAAWSLPGNPACIGPISQTFPVDHCLVQQTRENCQVAIAMDLLIAVLVCNFVKALSLYWSLRRVCSHPLLTLGDAVASFLETPDTHTISYSPISVQEVSRIANLTDITPAVWKGRRKLGFHAASPVRWILYNVG